MPQAPTNLPVARAAPAAAGRADATSFEARRQRIAEQLAEKLDLGQLGAMDHDVLRRELRPVVEHLVGQEEPGLAADERDRMVAAVFDETFGFGPLEVLLRDPEIAEICVDGHGEISLRRRNSGRARGAAPVRFRDREHLQRIVERLTSNPAVGTESPAFFSQRIVAGGWRLSALVGTRAPAGPLLRLEAPVPRAQPFSNRPPRVRETIEQALCAKRPILLSGPAGSGKTALVETLVQQLAVDARVVLLESLESLRPEQPGVVRLVASRTSADNGAELATLVRGARELRPDWLVFDELSAELAGEAVAASMCDGCGVLAAIRARTPRGALERLESLICSRAHAQALTAVRRQIALAFDLIVHLETLSTDEKASATLQELSLRSGEWHLAPLAPE